MHDTTLFKLLDPLYVVAHEKDIKKKGRGGLLLLFSPILAPLLALALRWVSDNVITEGAFSFILAFISSALFFCTFCVIGLLLILLFSDGLIEGFRTLFSLFIPSKKGSSDNTVDYKKCKKQAQENLPEIYRRLRFYTLWAKQSGNEKDVERIQKIFDDYMKASGN